MNKRWIPEETDRFLDYVFEGTYSEQELAEEFDCTLKAIERQFELYIYLEDKSKIHSYEPVKRVWREDRRLTGLEKNVIIRHYKLDIGMDTTARILQRPVAQLDAYLHNCGIKTTTRTSKLPIRRKPPMTEESAERSGLFARREPETIQDTRRERLIRQILSMPPNEVDALEDFLGT